MASELLKDAERQMRFLDALMKHHGAIGKALIVSSVTSYEWQRWKQDPDFIEKLAICKADYVASLKEKAYALAMEGDGKMLEFLLQAEDPETYDSKYRVTKLLAVKTIDITPPRIGPKELRALEESDPINQCPSLPTTQEKKPRSA